MSSVIIVPECLQDSHQIQDLTVKHLNVQEKQEEDEQQCPQCGVTPNQSSIRLVHDTCGHLKCRLCLLKEENGCLTCEQERIKIYSAAQQRYNTTKRSPVIEERVPVLVQTPHEQTQSPSYIKPDSSPVFSEVQSPPPLSYYGLQAVAQCTESTNPCQSNQEELSVEESNELPPDSSPSSEVVSELEVRKPRPTIVRKKRSPVFMFEHIVMLPDSQVPHYKCNICQKTFKTRSHIRYHQFCASGEKPFQCEQCEQSFVTKSHYEYHIRSHQGIRPFVCKVCGKSFPQKGKLTRHLTMHTGEKKFVCEQCGKRFSNSSSINNHKLVHSGEKPHACTQCGRRFAEISNLKKHIVTHTNFKPYMCEECGKAFSLTSALNVHRKTHSRDRDYPCQVCPKSFTNKRDLKRHSLIHTDLRPHSCPLCNVAIRRKDNLERHMRNTHPELSGNCDSDPGYITLPHEPPRANAVPVINSAPPANMQSQPLALDTPHVQSLESQQPLALDIHHDKPLPAVTQHHGYTTRNLHPENSPHLFIASKNINPV